MLDRSGRVVGQDVTVMPPAAVPFNPGTSPALREQASLAEQLVDLARENERLRTELEERRQTQWTLGKAATALALVCLSGEVAHDNAGGILISRAQIDQARLVNITVAETVEHDMVVRVRERADVPAIEGV